MIRPITLKRNLTRLFFKRGVEGIYTTTFDGLSSSQQSTLKSYGSFTDEELPIIGGYKDEKEWLLITTEKITWCFDGTRFCIPLSSVIFATVDFDAMQEKRLTMDKVDEILVTTNNQGVMSLRMEAGGPMCGVWNVLLQVSRQNQSK